MMLQELDTNRLMSYLFALCLTFCHRFSAVRFAAAVAAVVLAESTAVLNCSCHFGRLDCDDESLVEAGFLRESMPR